MRVVAVKREQRNQIANARKIVDEGSPFLGFFTKEGAFVFMHTNLGMVKLTFNDKTLMAVCTTLLFN